MGLLKGNLDEKSVSSAEVAAYIGSLSGNTVIYVLPAAGRAGIQNAYNALAVNGGIIQLVAGTYTLDATPIVPVDKVVLRGVGMGVTLIQQTVLGVRAFQLLASAFNSSTYLAFEDFTVVGLWLTNQSLGGDADRHFAVNGVTRLRFSNVESLYCRQMGITAQWCSEVLVDGCRVRFCARDAINLSGSTNCKVVNSVILHCADDAIGIHQEAADGNPPNEGHVIANNTIIDSYGIKVLGASKCVISGNVLRRVKGYGIYFHPGGSEGYSDLLAVNIFGNNISDIINASFFGGGSVAVGIYVGSAAKSFAKPVIGGVTPVYTYPESLYYLSNAVSAQNAGAQGVNVFGNILFGFTLPAGLYSAWGFGLPFSATGIADVDLSSNYRFSVTGVALQDALLSVSIRANHIEAMQDCIKVFNTLNLLDCVTISNNLLKRFSVSAVTLASSGVQFGRGFIDFNTIDGDPYFESAARTNPADGTWASGTAHIGFNINNYKGVTGRGNSFRNVQNVATSSSGALTLESNTFYFQPDSTASLTSGAIAANKGIRSAGFFGNNSDLLVQEDSNPTSATYGQELGRSTPSAVALPTSGYYIAGQFVRNLGFTQAGSGGSQYVIIGWTRITTGNGQVLNTDWLQCRALTGN